MTGGVAARPSGRRSAGRGRRMGTVRIVGVSPPPDGATVTIAWWHGAPAVIQSTAPGSHPIPTKAGPQWGLGNDATGILVLMAFILAFGAMAWGLRIQDHYGALLTSAYVVPPLFLVAAVGWLALVLRRCPATRAATGSRRRAAP
ncbi:hypothetical protein ABH920_006071 [Catenulispora sp. EB89]|uniref:hypothetical protein n=1 Tax=Catenulispora sp. EB89 TaxID=3156257 RepID=UPI003519812B